jgi:uncharacterized membrane-anchored protein
MYTSLKTPFRRTIFKPAAFFWLLPVFTIFFAQCCKADQPSLLSLTSPSQTQVEWTSGPADASLGTLADIKIPKGYRFTDATGASALLGRMNNPIPQGLVGILAPESGQWWVVLTYKDIGYVKDADKGEIDAAAILKAISDRANRQNEERTIHGLPPISSVDWALAPAFDAKTHAVEWAVLAKTQSAGVVNHTMRLLGRQGVLDATAVEPYRAQAASGLVPLKELVKKVSFKQGQRYADYQAGDKVSDIRLAGLITGEDDSPVAQKNDVAASSKSAGVWGWYILAGVFAGGGIMLFRGVVHQRRKARRVLVAGVIDNGNSVSNVTGNGTAHAAATSPIVQTNGNGSELGDMKPKVAIAQNGNGSTNHRGSRRRKKVFDYHRFYTGTVMKISGSGYTAEFPTSNSHTNGHTNGHSLDRATEGQSLSYEAMNQAVAQAHLDLIANQKDLIEEQKRLMIQQAKLIEEKSKLIAEKSQLLDRQTELFERDIL